MLFKTAPLHLMWVARPEGATTKVEIAAQVFASVINCYIRIWRNSKDEQSISLKDCILLMLFESQLKCCQLDF